MPSATPGPVLTATSKHPNDAKKPNPLPKPITQHKKPITQPVIPQSKNVKFGVWSLQSTELEVPEKTESLFAGPIGHKDESVIGEDGRKRVSKKDFMPGGKYRSIVKLFLRFAGQDENAPWAMATGWLINSDTIVTAGHCSYDWSHSLGRLTIVKAYIGYNGKESVKDNNNNAVQFRTGKRIAAPQGWLTSGDNEPRDVSFIQVDRPFTGTKPIKYQPTPLTGSKVVLGVVGYPGDFMNPKSKEHGAFMYDMYSPTTFNVSKAKDKMLEYRIDTFGGNSGSPVIRKSDMASIGVHVLGGNPNSASLIAGPLGNPFDAAVAALKGKSTGSHNSIDVMINGQRADWLSWVTVPTKESALSDEADASDETGTGGPDEDVGDTEANIPSEQPDPEATLDEGFFGLIRTGLQVSGPLGMIASIGLGAVGQILKKKRESSLDEAYSFEGVAERAMLGEAALTTIVHLGPSKCKDLGIFQRMQPIVKKLQPSCKRAAPVIMPFVMEPVWRATTGGLTLSQKQTGEAGFEPARIPTSEDTNTLGLGPRLDANAEQFISKITESLTMDDAKAFANTEFNIGRIIGKALRVIGPILGSVAESGLPRLDDGTEAAVDSDPEADVNNPASSEYTYNAMAQRAIAGEAALEALLQTPMESLQQEGWLDAITAGLKRNSGVLGPGVSVLTGAMSIAQAAINLATAKKNAKKAETQVDPGHDQDDGGETAETGEGDAENMNGGEAGVDGEVGVDGEANGDGEPGVDGMNGGEADLSEAQVEADFSAELGSFKQ